MKKVMLLGDSIREWYSREVRRLLEGKCEVIFAEKDNGRFTTYTLCQEAQLLKQHGKVDLVHFNNGYWDMSVMPFLNRPLFSTEEYKHGLRRIIELSRAAGAKVVFATTTPLPADSQAKDNTGTGADFTMEKENVIIYNKAALEVMEEENVTVNDLYSFCKQDKRYYKCEDNLHHSEEGNKIIAKEIADFILKELNIE